MPPSIARALNLLSVFVCAACTGTIDPSSSGETSSASFVQTTAATDAASASSAASTGAGGAPVDGGATGGGGAAPVDPCASALFCEKFDDYPAVTSIADGQKFGPWHAALATPGATMDLDGTHTTSGAHALHVRIEMNDTAGGRLFADGSQPLFQNNPTHIYGRMMMYIDPNGSSVHWTFFGESGDAEPSSPVVGRRATYLMSSLPKSDVNTYSFVYGLQASGGDPYHDCYFQSGTSMPTAAWTCIAFDMDSVARKLRMYMDGDTTPAVSLDDHGQGCVGSVPGDGPWYGPAVDQIYVGAWSFHPMVAPLEVWIDDLVVDTKPVLCPSK